MTVINYVWGRNYVDSFGINTNLEQGNVFLGSQQLLLLMYNLCIQRAHWDFGFEKQSQHI